MTDVTAITIPQLTGEMVARAGFKSEKDFLIKAQADSDLDAYEAFLECEEEASGKLKASKRVFTEAVLNEIRERSLWVFSGQPSWTAYLGAWCDNEGAKPSTAFKFLALVKIWQGGLGKPAKELTEYADGVYTVLPLLDKSKGKPPLISGYDPETGDSICLSGVGIFAPRWRHATRACACIRSRRISERRHAPHPSTEDAAASAGRKRETC